MTGLCAHHPPRDLSAAELAKWKADVIIEVNLASCIPVCTTADADGMCLDCSDCDRQGVGATG